MRWWNTFYNIKNILELFTHLSSKFLNNINEEIIYFEEVEITIKDNPGEVFEFKRTLKLHEMSIFNEAEVRD